LLEIYCENPGEGFEPDTGYYLTLVTWLESGKFHHHYHHHFTGGVT